MDEQKQPGVRIDQVFLVSVDFRHREDYLTLSPKTEVGELSIGLSAQILTANEGRAAAVRLRITSKPESKPLYEFTIEMMALISAVPGEENLPPVEYVSRLGISMLVPFIRETIANITSRGRFGPIWLKPINVMAATKQLEAEAARATVP